MVRSSVSYAEIGLTVGVLGLTTAIATKQIALSTNVTSSPVTAVVLAELAELEVSLMEAVVVVLAATLVLEALAELEEEHSGEEGPFSELDKVNKAAVNARIKEIRRDPEAAEELAVLREWLELSDEEASTKKALKAAEAELDDQAYGRYDSLTGTEVRELVVQGKWLASLGQAVAAEVERVSQALTSRLKQLSERYGEALPAISERVEELEARVAGHLERMGFAWN
jgi:type I restriction enzyme M protein